MAIKPSQGTLHEALNLEPKALNFKPRNPKVYGCSNLLFHHFLHPKKLPCRLEDSVSPGQACGRRSQVVENMAGLIGIR